MNLGEKKRFLKSYLEEKKELESITESIEFLRASSTYLPGYAANLDELERKMQAKQREVINIGIRIEVSIMEMKELKERMVLRYRYIQGMRWEEVCIKMRYCLRHVRRIHTKALKNMSL